MGRAERPSGLLATAGFLGLVVAATWIMQTLPTELTTALIAWMLISIPLGVMVGHGALSESEVSRGG